MLKNINLSTIKKGQRAKISNFQSDILPAKFYELGFRPGTMITVMRKAPLSGPICVQITDNNALVALRIAEAKLIVVEEIS